MTSSAESDPEESLVEVEEYELIRDQDVDDEPPDYTPLGPGDVFEDVALDHLAEPFHGPVMVVGHPCSLRRGMVLQMDVPVAPIVPQGVPTNQHPKTDRLLPVRKLVPPGSSTNGVVDLTRTTTTPAAALERAPRCACLGNAGIVALQQRLIGNIARVKVPPAVIAKHCRGPLTELELWKDWRGAVEDEGLEPASLDSEFDRLMTEASGFGALTWRDAIAEHEHARGSAVAAVERRVAELIAARVAG